MPPPEPNTSPTRERRYRDLFDALDDGFCIVEMLFDEADHPVDYRFIEVNPTFEAQTGLVNAVGHTARELVPGLEAHWFEVYGRVATTGEPVRFENGSEPMNRWFDVYAFRVGPAEAREVAIVFRDATAGKNAARERERLVAALSAERARLTAVFRQSPSFLAVLRGTEHVFDFVNDAYTRLVGGRDVVGKRAVDALPEIRSQGFDRLLDQVYTTGEPFIGRETPVDLVATSGATPERRILDFQYQPLVEPDESGVSHTAGVIAHGIDVTEQVRARQAIEQARAQSDAAWAEADAARQVAERARRSADIANLAKSEFLATMSHEIRTPINAIQGYAELLDLGIGGPVTAAQHDYLARLANAGQHLLGLVNDVLDLAKVDAGELVVARETGMTESVVQAALDLTRPLADARDIRLIDGNPSTSVPYVGDEHRVRQILVNLLSNAAKFTDAGGSATVTCGTVTETPPATELNGAGPWAFIRVEDTGIGIQPTSLTLVFDPFHQVEQGRTRRRGGTGLGLAISRRLARLMGGDLTVESTPGAGSVFTLWLPTTGGTEWGSDGEDETAAERGGRAARVDAASVRGLANVGSVLRTEQENILRSYVDRMRTDPQTPLARTMRTAELEDHLSAFLADIAQSLLMAEGRGADTPDLIADGAAIGRAIAERHGARRAAQGWDESAIRRDYVVLGDVIMRAIRSHPSVDATDAAPGLAIVRALVDRAEVTAVQSWRAATHHVPLPSSDDRA